MDEYNDNMTQLEWDGDDGLQNLFGLYMKQPDEAFCKKTNLSPLLTQIEVPSVSPKRDAMRKRAHEETQKNADVMIKNSRKSYDNDSRLV